MALLNVKLQYLNQAVTRMDFLIPPSPPVITAMAQVLLKDGKMTRIGMMSNKFISPAQEEELKFLRNEVDKYSEIFEERKTLVPKLNSSGKFLYNTARLELKEFVEKLRLDGYNI